VSQLREELLAIVDHSERLELQLREALSAQTLLRAAADRSEGERAAAQRELAAVREGLTRAEARLQSEDAVSA
jgi:hypothetical protein